MEHLTWRASTYSSGQGGNCVEVADLNDGTHFVRDSKDRYGVRLRVDHREWTAFIGSVRSDTFTI